ncbi:MAG: alternate F1F0 ATPase, F1 subunit alpha [Bacteroidota bacterium]
MNMEPESLQNVFDITFDGISQVRKAFTPQLKPREVGTITSVGTGIATVSGLPGVGFDELVTFPGDVLGIASNVDADEIGVILLGEYWRLHAGDEVQRTGRVMDVAVGDGLLGRVIDPLGRPLDGSGLVASGNRLPVERPAAPIMGRAPVTVPLQTGLKVIDALIPVGRGQRELILGDRQTGKTAIAIDTILNQRDQNVLCVYCAIGQRAAAVAKAVANLRETGAMDYTVVVVTEGNDPPGLAYIAPYAATSIAEFFMEAGRDVLIVYDDLTHHARAYRELSLLLRRPPGREAFPGDIFYIHSRLLERATHLHKELGGGSLTALPIIETQAQDISAYIPTNLISITDGQIYLSPTLFELGVLPAVDVGKSVSRVGGKAQRAAYRAVAGDLKLGYAQFEELEAFSRFGARLDEDTRKIIEHGQRIRACLKQPEFAPIPVPEQIAVLLALTSELFDHVPLEKMKDAESALREATTKIPVEVSDRLNTAEKLSDEDRKTIIEIARMALEAFQPEPEKSQKTKVDAKSKDKSKPKSKSNEPGPDSNPNPRQETEAQAKPKAKAESKSDAKPNKSNPEPELEPKQKFEEDSQPKDQAELQSKPEAKSDGTKPELKPQAAIKEKSGATSS